MAGTAGALYPVMALVFGDAVTAFLRPDGSVNIPAINTAALQYFYIAIAMFVTEYTSYVLFSLTAERQMKVLREKALRHMLHLDIGWYDSHDAMQLSSRLTSDTMKIKDGMGHKLGDSCKYTCQFIAGYVIGFSKSWDISLIMLCAMPFMVAPLAYLLIMVRKRSEHSQQIYAEAGSVAEETLGSIRTVASLNGEAGAIAKYNEKSFVVEQDNIKIAKSYSTVHGLLFAGMWIMFSAGLWYGGSKVVHLKKTPGEVFQAFIGIWLGTYSMALISPSITAVVSGKGAAGALYKILDTPSAIDASSEDGFIPESCAGRIQAIDVNFSYPSRPDAQILINYNVIIESGQTVAFVGPSGGGKSTLIALLERFYNPTNGVILLDGRDISSLNVKWLRSQIGLVSQEPVLFATTIYENIAAGRGNVTRDQVIEAAKLANAHTFIMSLPENYDTLVGEKGVSLSGGQKQRVAIARAIVREPKILMLDEATSALDSESEHVVQAALNDLMDKTQMTTLVIAHRLSTVRRADKIVVLSDGTVVEEGPHDALLQIKNGVYRNLYTIQEEKAHEEAEAAAAEIKSVSLEVVDVTRDRKAIVQSVRTGGHGEVKPTSDDESEDPAKKPQFSMFDTLALSRSERKYMITGLVAAAFNGCGYPMAGVLMSEMLAVMTEKYAIYEVFHIQSYLSDLSHDVTFYGLCYIGGGILSFFFTAIQTYCFKYMAEKLIYRLRDIHFTALCRQNIAFFDEKENSTGALTADLSAHTIQVALLSGESQGQAAQAFFTFVAAIVISFTTGSWQLTFIMLGMFPLLMLGQYLQAGELFHANDLPADLAQVGARASEALSNIRTVASLGLEGSVLDKFAISLKVPMKRERRKSHTSGMSLGFASFVLFATYSLVFWYGGYLVDHGKITFKQLSRTLLTIMMSNVGIGLAVSFFNETQNATKAGAALVGIRDRELPIDSFGEGGLKPSKVAGKLEFKNVAFRYPTRPDVVVLKNYNLTIEPGQTVAFCGQSGGGKSTCISLIERFYDPLEGQVLLDGNNLKDLNLNWLRSQIGLVGQEPTLFSTTIAENISFGLHTKPSQEEIEAAAKMANAHDFISQFPDGYETQVGLRGEQLSGGQKQRIAIARAILKNPEILLLDEATSALDSESEKVVQEALDKVVALKRRTTIIIAHRLSTIRKADKICVVSGGKIAEEGTHTELLARNGIYARLVETASREA
uniref:Bile salt export pump n=1 Tax=Globisporangium ultimum (strain ATCC 200006 / CBS 805.95 / DAOM BR144) TaxID=431595 RepID=K3WTD5_GLOUD